MFRLTLSGIRITDLDSPMQSAFCKEYGTEEEAKEKARIYGLLFSTNAFGDKFNHVTVGVEESPEKVYKFTILMGGEFNREYKVTSRRELLDLIESGHAAQALFPELSFSYTPLD